MATRTFVASGISRNWSATTSWVEGVVPTAADDVVFSTNVVGSILVIDGTSGSPSLCRSFDATGYSRTLTHAASRFLKVGDGTTGHFKLVSGMTYAPSTTSELHFLSTTTGNQITTAAKTMGKMVFNGAGGEWTAQDNIFSGGNGTFTAGTLSALSGKTFRFTTSTFNGATVNLNGDMTLTSTMTASGGTINGNGFQITGTSGAKNFSGTTVSGVTFIRGSSVICSASSLTLTSGIVSGSNLSISGGTVDFGVTLVNSLSSINISGGTVNTSTGGVIDGFGEINVNGTGSITGNGHIDLQMGTNFTMSSSGSVSLEYINLYNDAFYQSSGTVTIGNTGASVPFVSVSGGTLNMGNGTWYLNSAGDVTIWAIDATTLNAGSSTIDITDVGTGFKEFDSGSMTYHDLIIRGAASSGKIFMFGSPTFNDVTLSPNASIQFESSKTFTAARLLGGGTSGHIATITASTSGTFASLALGTYANLDYMSIKDNHVVPNSLAGLHSTDVSGNNGWFFSDVFPVTTPPVIGYTSGSYVTRMSEKEFKRRRNIFRHDLENTEFRLKMLDAIPELHEALIAPEKGETFKQKRLREKKLSNIIAKRILKEHEETITRTKAIAAEEEDDDYFLISYLIH